MVNVGFNIAQSQVKPQLKAAQSVAVQEATKSVVKAPPAPTTTAINNQIQVVNNRRAELSSKAVSILAQAKALPVATLKDQTEEGIAKYIKDTIKYNEDYDKLMQSNLALGSEDKNLDLESKALNAGNPKAIGLGAKLTALKPPVAPSGQTTADIAKYTNEMKKYQADYDNILATAGMSRVLVEPTAQPAVTPTATAINNQIKVVNNRRAELSSKAASIIAQANALPVPTLKEQTAAGTAKYINDVTKYQAEYQKLMQSSSSLGSEDKNLDLELKALNAGNSKAIGLGAKLTALKPPVAPSGQTTADIAKYTNDIKKYQADYDNILATAGMSIVSVVPTTTSSKPAVTTTAVPKPVVPTTVSLKPAELKAKLGDLKATLAYMQRPQAGRGSFIAMPSPTIIADLKSRIAQIEAEIIKQEKTNSSSLSSKTTKK